MSIHRCGRGETINALGRGPSHYGFESHRSPLWVFAGSVADAAIQHDGKYVAMTDTSDRQDLIILARR
jgi:hypothetical protein